VHHVDAVHILQSICGVNQLNESVTLTSASYGAIAHELSTVNSLIILYELIDVTVIHPLGYHRESVVFQSRTDKR